MKIHIPNSAWIGNIDPFLRSFDERDKCKLEITSHKKWISVHPLVLCMIVALGLEGKRNKVKINFEKIEATSRHYLERMGVFKALIYKSDISVTEHEPSGRFIPISKITNSAELNRFITDMIPLLHREPRYVKPIKYIISELVRNVLEHSKSKDGAIVCAQFYKKSNTIRIGVVDNGIGIKESLMAYYPTKKDSEAIKLALTPGVTGTTRRIDGSAENAGAGLFFIKSIAIVNRDFFMIYSGKGMYKLLKARQSKRIRINANPFLDHSTKEDNFPDWTGTVIGIDISLDKNMNFDSLFDLIHSAYMKGVKARRKERYKRAKFI